MDRSRELSIDEYLKVLQLEYFTHKVRSLIFDKPEFIKMANDIAEFKKERIELLAKKHFKRSIFFSVEEYFSFYEKEFLNPTGIPNFQYSTNEQKRNSQWFWDMIYLLGKDQVVIYDEKECRVLKNDIKNQTVIIKVNGKKKDVEYSNIKIKRLIMCFDGKLL